MDFVEVASQTATAFADNKLLYLHCVDFRATETVCLNDFPCLGVKLVLGHVSFPRKLAERRMSAFLNRRNLMDDLKDRRSPVLIEVLNSCDIKSNDRTLTVVVEFIVVPNSYTVKAKPRQDYEEEDPLPTIPWLDVLVCSCNCSSFPRIGNIVVNANNGNKENPYELELSDDCESEEDIPGDIEVSIQESDSNEQDDNNNNYAGAAANDDNDDGNQCVGDITEKFTEYFALKGSSYHEDCQKALKRCKQLQLS